MPVPIGQGRAQRDPREEMLRHLLTQLQGKRRRSMPQGGQGQGMIGPGARDLLYRHPGYGRPQNLPHLGGGPELMNALRSMAGSDFGQRPYPKLQRAISPR